MALLSQSQSDNIETLVARIKQQASEAQQGLVDSADSKSPSMFNKPKSRPESVTQTDIVNRTVSRLREKALVAMEEQKDIYLDKSFDIEALNPKKEEVDKESVTAGVTLLREARSTNNVDTASIDAAITEATDTPTTSNAGLMTRPKGRPFITPEKYKIAVDQMSDREMLARTIEAEAAREKYNGKLAVAATIANRAASGNFGGGIRGVILKVGHFSPWNTYTGHDKGNQGKDMTKMKASEDSYKAADAILSGDYTDPTGGATHYVNEKVNQPSWLTKGGVDDVGMKGRARGTKQIGNHLFGNADNNQIFDGQAWAKMMADMATSPRPQKRPDTQVAGN